MGLEVIGAGFGRTGTMSLKIALEQLGFGPCYHMVECLARGPEHWQQWIEAVNGAPQWERLFSGFRSVVDFPACGSYKSLAQFYPQAKIILTVRDPESWFDSVQETIFSPHWINHVRNAEMGKFMYFTIGKFLQDKMHDKAHLIKRYEEHVRDVQATIPADRLLVFDVREGWEPLSRFLNVPPPNCDFPSVNESENTQNLLNKVMVDGFQSIRERGVV